MAAVLLICAIIVFVFLFIPRHFIDGGAEFASLRLICHDERVEAEIDDLSSNPAYDELKTALSDVLCIRTLNRHSYSLDDTDYVLHLWTDDGRYCGMAVGTDLNGRVFRICWKGEETVGHEFAILNYAYVEGNLTQAIRALAG